MPKIYKLLLTVLCAALLLTGCGLRTVDQLYCLPKRSDAEEDLQSVIDEAMGDLSYSAPIYGENRQVTQRVDLDGDGVEECLVFAKDNSEQPLKILIFCKLASGYVLMDTIEGYGFAFDFVEYAQMDGQPGLEIIVGRQLSDQVMRAVSVYRFSSEISRQLMSGSCTKFMTCDLDGDENRELLLLSPGESEGSGGVLSLYRLEDGQLQRTSLTNISAASEQVKRLNISFLQGGLPAVYVTSITKENTLVTDIFAMDGDNLTEVTKTEPVPPMDNYYIYPEDVDADGVLELPRLMPMPEYQENQRQRYFLCWYSVGPEGVIQEKSFTYTNFYQNWYVNLYSHWLDKLVVTDTAISSSFYILSERTEDYQKILTVYTLADSDRQQVVQENKYTVLYESEAVIYAIRLEPDAQEYGLTEELFKSWFHIMRTELNTDEN